MAEKQVKKEAKDLEPVEAQAVAPIESVEQAPPVQEKIEAELVIEELAAEGVNTKTCWNCGEKLANGKCGKCGFDISKMYNLDLEADKASKRQQAVT